MLMKVLCANLTHRPDTVHPVPCRPPRRPEPPAVRRLAVARFTSFAGPSMLGLPALGVLTATAQPRLAPLLKGKWPNFASGEAFDLKVVGQHAYVAVREGGLAVFDVTIPANPVPVGGYDTSRYSIGLAVSGNHAYVADSEAGWQVIDVSNPAKPVRVGG